MTQSKQTVGDKTRLKILKAGVRIWPFVSLSVVARECDVTHAAISYHFGSLAGLRMAIAEHAVETNNSRVIVQLVATEHPVIKSMSDNDRKHHFARV